MRHYTTIRFSTLSAAFFLLLLLLPGQSAAASLPNRVDISGADPARLQGVVAVHGVADHSTFRKWQLDLLINGTDPVFLALGEERVIAPSLLTSLDTRLYPDGAHRLRLRVVYGRLNYDEYFLPIQIANQDSPGTQQVTPVQPPEAEPLSTVASSTRPAQAGNGLSLIAQHSELRVRGVAAHPTFRKWQVDLLLNGDPTQVVFLAVGEERAPVEQELVTVDTTAYPPGAHQVRLRVVHSNLNYDEYLSPLTIGPGGMGGIATSGSTTNAGRTRLMARGPVADNAIYLTFDDGPHPRNTPRILEVLAEYNAKATFFVVGSQAQGRGALLKEIYDGGHAIANHSWSHRKLGDADWETFEREVGATARVLGRYGSRCLRPPYGDIGANLSANAAEAGYALVYWGVDSGDWKNQDAEAIAEEVLAHAKPGAIVLMHDGGGSRAGTVEALRTILATLSEEGYTFPALCR